MSDPQQSADVAEMRDAQAPANTCPSCHVIVAVFGEHWPHWIGEKPAHPFCFYREASDE